VLLAEANQWPEDLLPYFGDGDDEFHMGFNFPIMPRIFMALKQADRTQLVWIMSRTPFLRESNQWGIFLRNHDELTLEMVTEDERQWMWEQYAPDPRMRLNIGIRRRLAPLLDNDRRKIELAHSLLFTLPGSPTMYYGDEIGMGDNIWLPDRNGVRTPMQWNDEAYAGFSNPPIQSLYSPVIDDEIYGPQEVNVELQREDPSSMWNAIRHMIAKRKEHMAFGWGEFEWMDLGTDTVAAYQRSYNGEKILVVQNLDQSAHEITISDDAVDIITGTSISRGNISVEPFQYLWLLVANE
jgi:maltose alpha-D-glucosyltransferase/alpha-amylase